MRDCKNCIHRTKNGCDSWDCEFEKRMPNEEAIKVLEMVEAYGIADRAKRAAICALKNEQTDGDLISRTDAIKAIREAEINFNVISDINFSKHKREIQEIVNNILSAQIKAISELKGVEE
jgi:hypothetical protein